MFLKGEKVALRAVEPADAEWFYRWENDMRIWSASYTQVPFSRFVLEEFATAAHNDIYTNKQLRLMVQHATQAETVGAIDLFEYDPQHQRCGIGIFIEENFRQGGVATECLQMVRQYCFHTLHVKQIFAYVSSSNPASLSLFEKAGFERAGLKKCWARVSHNSYEDVWFLQCINPS